MEPLNIQSEWEKIAIYFADCQAATTEQLTLLKSPSKSELKRHQLICRTLLQSIREQQVTNIVQKERVMKRLEAAIIASNEKV